MAQRIIYVSVYVVFAVYLCLCSCGNSWRTLADRCMPVAKMHVTVRALRDVWPVSTANDGGSLITCCAMIETVIVSTANDGGCLITF